MKNKRETATGYHAIDSVYFEKRMIALFDAITPQKEAYELVETYEPLQIKEEHEIKESYDMLPIIKRDLSLLEKKLIEKYLSES